LPSRLRRTHSERVKDLVHMAKAFSVAEMSALLEEIGELRREKLSERRRLYNQGDSRPRRENEFPF
jgi:hypothetical protein